MFQLTTNKQALLTPLLIVSGAVDNKQSMQISAHIPCSSVKEDGEVTIPAKKIIDIVKSLEDDAEIILTYQDNVVAIKSGRSKFKLTTLPADNYPSSKYDCSEVEFNINTASLIRLL